MRGFRVVILAVATVVLSAHGVLATFTTFESGHVRPLALSPDGSRLFAVNTPDDQLEIFAVDPGTGALTHDGSVPVGLEPVAVAARSNAEVWVVNHLSDSVSIVDVGATPPRVVRTLLVGDEPRDVVFAGTGGTRAFITTAHRGQNRPGDPQLTTPGIGRADVWVFDATSLGATSLGGTPLSILTLFTDTPRALAVSPDGNTVYAAGFHSGNRTTAISEGAVCDGGARAGPCNVFGSTMPGGLPAPNTNFQGIAGPETGLIVRFDPASGHWEDELGRNWDNAVRFNLPDRDVFAIDANNLATPPTSFAGVGTILFNMVTNPVSGKVYVSNTEARNEVRFEGPGVFGGSTRARAPARGAHHGPRRRERPAPTPEQAHRLRRRPEPGGTSRARASRRRSAWRSRATAPRSTSPPSAPRAVGIFDTAELENDTFTPSAARSHPRHRRRPERARPERGGAPALRLHAVRRCDLRRRHDDGDRDRAPSRCTTPSRPTVVTGRPILYDARLSSSNGEAACASCHVFARLRQPRAGTSATPTTSPLNNPNPFEVGGPTPFHPMKGPMTTQSLRGMANHGPMHWRGDRTGGNDPGGNPLDENAAFNKFIVAFDGLLGRGGPISASRDAGVRRLHPAGHLSAEPDPRARRLAHRRTAGRAATSSSDRSPTASATATAATW